MDLREVEASLVYIIRTSLVYIVRTSLKKKKLFNIPFYSEGQGLLLKTELSNATPVVVFPEL